MDIRALAYVVVGATDPEAWRRFGESVVGMAAVGAANGGVALKMDERCQRILVERSEADRYIATGWEVADAAAFRRAVAELRNAGVTVTPATPDELATRRAQEMTWFRDPVGNRHELVWGFKADFARFVSPQGVSRFVTGPLGMGHTVLPARDFDRTYAFLANVMGFALSDILVHRDGAGNAHRIYFLHCNNGRHHSLALFEGEVPAGCVHLMVEVESMDEVGRAYDRVRATGTKLMCTLGRHVNDEVISFYFATPGNFALEFGYGGKVIDWTTHVAFESSAVSLWGHDFSIGFN